jgi:hypothetical protein
MPKNNGLLTDDARHARWRAMVSAWRCAFCDCHDHARTVLNPVCTRCKHTHLFGAADRQTPAPARAPRGTPLFDPPQHEEKPR